MLFCESKHVDVIDGSELIKQLGNYATWLTLVCLAVACFFSTMSHAQQTGFKAIPKVQDTQFSYQWQQQDQRYTLEFTIPNAALLSMPDSPASYNQRIFQEAVYRQVMLEAKRFDPRLARINVTKNNNGLSFNVESKQPGQAQLILNQLSDAHAKAQSDYWTNNFFTEYRAPTGETGIRHDHSKYTQLSSLSLAPVVEAIKQIQQQPNNPREFVEIALSWIQSIPYDTLESRLSSNGAGFVSPRDLLLQNKGDCDSKATLMAALLKAYSPNINIEMVYLRNHALLGLAMRVLPGEQSINKKGIAYVLIEPTGPAQLPIGEVGDSTKLALRNRQFHSSAL